MEPSSDQAHSAEEVTWSTTTTTKTWSSTTTTSSSEAVQQAEELNTNNSNQLEFNKLINSNQLELDSTINSKNVLENLQGKDIKINVDNSTTNNTSSSQLNSQNTSTSTSTMSSTTTTITEVREVAVAEHNKYRRIHGAPDLKSDARLHDEAQRYAETLARGSKDTFKTSKTHKYGENIATSTKKDKAEAIKDAITRMYATSKDYDYQRPGFNVDNKPTGLFTSIVWKSSERIGVGCAWNQVEENYAIVFYYDPMTNITSEFKENVLPPRA